MTHPNFSTEWHDNSSLSSNDTADDTSTEIIETVLPATMMAVLIFLTLQGNLWILVAIFTNPLLRASSSSVFVINLMLLGLLASCLALPLAVAVFVIGPDKIDPMLCNVSGFFNTCFMICSMLHLSLISIDRFYSIILPMHHAAHATPRLYIAVSVIAWCLSLGISLMPLPDVSGDSHGFLGEESYCTFNTPRSKSDEIFICIVVVVAFFLPSLILISMYAGVFHMARKAAHTVLPHLPSPNSRHLSFQVPLTDQNNASSTHAWTVTEATGQSDDSQHREVSALIFIPELPSAEPNNHQLFNGAVPSRSTQAKTAVGYPTAKVSPTNYRQTFPPHRPKAIDPSIFSVSSQTAPAASVCDQRAANSRKSKAPRLPDTCPTINLRGSLAGGGEGESRGFDSSYSGQLKTAAVKPANHVSFVCGCASGHKSGNFAPKRNTRRATDPSSGTSFTGTRFEVPVCQKRSKTPRQCFMGRSEPFIFNAVNYIGRNRPGYAKAFRTVMIIVLSYFVFWSLYFVCQLHLLFHGHLWSQTINIFAIWLGFASYGVNPCLYGCMNRQIREEVTGLSKGLRKRIKVCCCCCFWAFYRHFITPEPSHADSMCACCVPPREASDDSSGDVVDGIGEGGESFFQFLQRTQDGNTPVPKSVFQSEH